MIIIAVSEAAVNIFERQNTPIKGVLIQRITLTVGPSGVGTPLDADEAGALSGG